MNYLIKDENSQYYKCGYSCDNAIVLGCENENFFITDSRYTTEANEQINKNTIVIESSDIIKSARELIRKSNIFTIAYDPKEWKISDFENLKEKLPKVNFKPKENLTLLQRAVKSDKEISFLKEAVKLGAKAFDGLADFLNKTKEQLSEQNIHFKANEFLTSFGELDLSFEPILAINENAAKPHAKPTKSMLKKDDLILFDAGVKYNRYCSDRTRTAFFSNGFDFSFAQNFKNQKIQKAYDLVLKAHDEAIKQAKIGMKASELDKIARDIIAKGGYEKEFVHSLGHGVGLNIHEFPFINKKSQTILEENMVFTIEPGIYIPNEFGIRIEDMVVLKSDGAYIL